MKICKEVVILEYTVKRCNDCKGCVNDDIMSKLKCDDFVTDREKGGLPNCGDGYVYVKKNKKEK